MLHHSPARVTAHQEAPSLCLFEYPADRAAAACRQGVGWPEVPLNVRSEGLHLHRTRQFKKLPPVSRSASVSSWLSRPSTRSVTSQPPTPGVAVAGPFQPRIGPNAAREIPCEIIGFASISGEVVNSTGLRPGRLPIFARSPHRAHNVSRSISSTHPAGWVFQ